MEPVTYENTPSMLASQGYAGILDLMKALNLSRAGLYRMMEKIDPPPKSQKVGVRVYFEVQPIVNHVAKGGTVRQRAPKGKRGGTLAGRSGKAKP